MSLVEIARFTDVYEDDLAAAFLDSQGIRVFVTEPLRPNLTHARAFLTEPVGSGL